MQYLSQIFDFIQRLIVWWVIVSPWENAIRIRGGKKVKVLTAGIYLRIPFYDTVYIQQIRLRVTSIPPQTVSTSDGVVVTVSSVLGYSICDLQRMYQTMSHPESTLCNFVMGSVADYIAGTRKEDLTPSGIETAMKVNIDGPKYGVKLEYVKIVGFAVVRTIRLIQDQHWVPNSLDINTPIK